MATGELRLTWFKTRNERGAWWHSVDTTYVVHEAVAGVEYRVNDWRNDTVATHATADAALLAAEALAFEDEIPSDRHPLPLG